MVLCVGRVPLVAVWLKPSCRWLAPSSGWPLETVGAWREEGEREARWEEREREARWEGREREAALGSSPLPSLGSSPWALLPSPPWYSRPDYRSDCWSRRWGDTHARRRYARPGGVGMGGGRAAAAVPPSPALTSPSCFSSNQPVSLRGRRGWECSRAACASARGARSLSREGTAGRVSISSARTISHYMRHRS